MPNGSAQLTAHVTVSQAQPLGHSAQVSPLDAVLDPQLDGQTREVDGASRKARLLPVGKAGTDAGSGQADGCQDPDSAELPPPAGVRRIGRHKPQFTEL